MGKANIKPGAKLDVTARLADGEQELKSSFLKENGGLWQISTPMQGGKSLALAPGTVVSIVWIVENSRYSASGTVSGAIKQGIRTYLTVRVDEEILRSERRAHSRVTAELDVELSAFTTDRDGVRVEEVHRGKTTDISDGGVALLTNAQLATGEVITCTIVRRGVKKLPLKANVCWTHGAPKSTGYRDAVGLQFIFTTNGEQAEVAKLTAALLTKK